MTDPMSALVRRAARHSDEEITGLVGSPAETDLMARILAEPAPVAAPVLPAGTGHGRRPRRRARRLVALTGLVAAAAVGVSVLVSVQGDDGDRVAWAAEAIALADDTPRLLIDADGWRVEEADQLVPERGNMFFTKGDREVRLEWSTEWDLAAIVANREENGHEWEPAVVAGHEAMAFNLGEDTRATFWQHGDAVVEILTWQLPMDDDEYAALLAAVTQVDAETWLSALPGTVVRPDDTAAVIDELLAGITLPPGSTITEPAGAITRTQLAGVVEADARCAWIEEWIRGTDAGDTAAVNAAAAALDGASDWPVQSEVRPPHPEMWTEIDRLVADGVLPGGREIVIAGDTPMEGWREVFQCFQPWTR